MSQLPTKIYDAKHFGWQMDFTYKWLVTAAVTCSTLALHVELDVNTKYETRITFSFLELL